MLNLNPVIVAKHTRKEFKQFFTKVLLTNAKTTGKIVYYVQLSFDYCSCCRPMHDQNTRYEARVNAP